MIINIILAGGAGKRLWPLSSDMMPKQFIKLIDDKSPFQHAVDNVLNISDHIIIVCSKQNYELLKHQLKDYNQINIHILIEQQSYNTAIAICTACLYIDRIFGKTYVSAFPTDHYIDNFIQITKQIKKLCYLKNQNINIFGIKPNYDESEYGYIKKGNKSFYSENIYNVEGFKEKPDDQEIIEYINSDYLWNIGIISCYNQVLIKEIKSLSTLQYSNLLLYHKIEISKNIYLLDDITIEDDLKISIDYIILEKSKNLIVTELDIIWSDLGSWSNISKINNSDNENYKNGDISLHDCKNSFFYANKKVTAIDINNIVLVENDESIIISSKNRISKLKEYIKVQSHSHSEKPWGSFDIIRKDKKSIVKILKIKPGHKISLQSHKYRDERWVIIKGYAKVILNDDILFLEIGDHAYIPRESKHRLENIGDGLLEILEIQTGSYLSEDDIIRYDDDYNRQERNIA